MAYLVNKTKIKRLLQSRYFLYLLLLLSILSISCINSLSAQQNFNPYKILGISSESNEDQIKQKFRQLSKNLHPDKLIHPDISQQQKKKNQQNYHKIIHAYQTLKKSDFRYIHENYDKQYYYKENQGRQNAWPSDDDFDWLKIKIQFDFFNQSNQRKNEAKKQEQQKKKFYLQISQELMIPQWFSQMMIWIFSNIPLTIGIFFLVSGLYMMLITYQKK